MRKLITALSLLAILAAGPVAAAETVTVQATGMGVIYNGDVAKARDDAVKDAIRQAVEQTTGMFIDSQTRVEMFQTLEDSIYARSNAYVTDYRVIDEGYGSFENSYEATVECTVAVGLLEERLAELDVTSIAPLIGNPRIMVIVEEENLLQGYHYYWWDWSSLDMGTTEMTLQEILIDNEFDLVDAAQARNNIDRDMVMAALTGDAMAAAEIGLQYGAEYVITGKAVVKGSDITAYGVTSGSGMRSYQATVNLKAYSTGSARMVASTSKSASAAHTDDLTGGNEALRQATRQAADKVMDQILKAWAKEAASGQRIQVTVYNADSATLNKLMVWMQEQIRGVERVTVRQHFGLTAKLEVESDYDAGQLAKEINYKPWGEGDFEVLVYGQSYDQVQLAVAPKGEEPPDEEEINME